MEAKVGGREGGDVLISHIIFVMTLLFYELVVSNYYT